MNNVKKISISEFNKEFNTMLPNLNLSQTYRSY